MKPTSKLSWCIRHKLNQAHALMLKPIWTVTFQWNLKVENKKDKGLKKKKLEVYSLNNSLNTKQSSRIKWLVSE